VRDARTEANAGVTVIDTDSRLLAPSESARVVREVVSGVDPRTFDLIYKKTDSAFRGSILAEVETLLDILKRPGALLVPHNPSRGRTVRDGQYRINGVLLDQTGFADDPDHPARTSKVVDLLGNSKIHQVVCLNPDEPVLADRISIGAAERVDEVRGWARRCTRRMLPVGGADFFAANLEALGLKEQTARIAHLDGERRLFVCGSASSYSRELIARAQREGMALCLMPDDVFAGADVEAWANAIVHALHANPRVLIVLAQPLERSRDASQRIQSALASTIERVLVERSVDHLFLEGGATASAICRKMGWNDFAVCGELETGVVQLRVADHGDQSILIKPGSYPWPEVVWR
jgi:uncharacterized protein YgbK (DUF1537 family)